MSPIPNGTYDFVGSAVRAFRAPGVTRAKVEALKDIAQAAKEGRLSVSEAEERAAELESTFASLMKWANGNAGALGILIAIISLWMTIYAVYDSDQSSAQAHEDAQRQLQATQTQIQAQQTAIQVQQTEIEVQQTQLQVQQKIYESLQALNAAVPSQGAVSAPTELTTHPSQLQTPTAGALSRQQRRRIAQLAKKRQHSR